MPKSAAVSLLIKQLTKQFLAVPGESRSSVGAVSPLYVRSQLIGFVSLLLSPVTLLYGNIFKQTKEEHTRRRLITHTPLHETPVSDVVVISHGHLTLHCRPQ